MRGTRMTTRDAYTHDDDDDYDDYACTHAILRLLTPLQSSDGPTNQSKIPKIPKILKWKLSFSRGYTLT